MATGIPFAPSGAPNVGYGLNVGFPYTGTPSATSGIPNMGGLLVNSSVRPTSSFAVNNFVSVMSHYVCISNPTDEKSKQNCRDLGLGMLVFVRETSLPPMDKNGSRRVRARYDGMSIGPNTAEFKELTMLNEYLADHSKDYSSAEEIIAEWRLMGVIKNEAAPTSVAYGSANYTRMLNLVVSHRVSVLKCVVQAARLACPAHSPPLQLLGALENHPDPAPLHHRAQEHRWEMAAHPLDVP